MRDYSRWPYIVRPGLSLIDDELGAPEAVMGTLNYYCEHAKDTGLRFQVCFADGEIVELTGRRITKLQFLSPSDDEYSIEEPDVVTITQAGELLGMSRDAVYLRVARANQAGEPTPFKRCRFTDIWLGERSAVLEWAASWKGRSKKRRRPSEKSEPIA
jgi:hypothetical protein